METGTYLTQITEGKQNEVPAHKFIRQNLMEDKITGESLEPVNKLRGCYQTIGKDANRFLPEEYYSVKKVKPRMNFYRAILEIEEKRGQPKLPELRVNLPETLVLLENSLQLLYSQKGVLKIKSYQNLNEFMKIVKLPHQPESIYSAVLMGVGSVSYTDFTVALSNELDLRILPKNENQVSIKFIQPFGDYPNMLRLFYFPKSVKGSKPNYAYKGMNKKKLSEEILERKHKQIYNYLVDFGKEQLIVTTLVMGKALEEVQLMTQSIVDYLEAGKKVKISEIVVDYIFSEERAYYFHEIKSIKSTNLRSVWDVGTTDQMVEKYKEQTNQISCKLCLHCFPRKQITKKVTNKLIAQLLIHLKNRGQAPFGSFMTKSTNLSALSHVCDICYQLIVAEHVLINIEQQFCSIVNVNSEQIVNLGRSKNPHPNILCSQQSQMTQWRMFFYIEKVKNFPFLQFGEQRKFTLNMKFSDFKETFAKDLKETEMFALSRARSSTPSRRIRESKISNRASRYEKKSTLHTNFTNRSNLKLGREQCCVDFQKIKLVTFYTESEDVSSVLMAQQLAFDLSYGNCKYRGQSSTLQNFSNKKSCQRHSCQVLLFGQQYEYCNLEITVGLICDGSVPVSDLDLSKSTKQNLFFTSDKGLRSCLPLPSQWMQIISQGSISLSPVETGQVKNSGSEGNSTYLYSFSVRNRKYRNRLTSKQKYQHHQESFL